MSLDGKIGLGSVLYPAQFQLSANPLDHQKMRALRDRVDAIVVGAGNVRADDPELGLLTEHAIRREAEGRRSPIRAVMTRSGRGLGPHHQIFDPTLGGETVVFHPAGLELGFRASLDSSEAPNYHSAGLDAVTVERVLEWLGTERGCETVLCEGGGEIYGAFMRARAIDELFITLVPRWLGGADAPTAGGGAPFALETIPEAQLVGFEAVEGELFLRYTFSWSQSLAADQ